jgi:signal transduction histidine kinase
VAEPEGSGQRTTRRLGGRERLWARLGLRGRITFLFGSGALLLSLIMGSISYLTASHFLVTERQSATLTKALTDAATVQTGLDPALDNSAAAVIDQLDLASGTGALLLQHGGTYPSALGLGVGSVPAAMVRMVRSGTPAVQTYVLGGAPHLAVGIPIPAVHAVFFEIVDVSDLQHTLRVLLLALTVAGLITTVLGAVVGRTASERSLRPLNAVSRAARAIAGGQLATRLTAAAADPDLAGLTSSFNLMVDQLEERIQREARFNSDVSHELRSPLTTLGATLEVLEAHQEQLSPRARQALLLLGADLRRFERMVADLLEISRSDAGSSDVVLEEVSAGELVRRAVVASSRTLPRFEPPPVHIAGEAERIHLLVDKRRFERVMANLLENAALYGGGATKVITRIGPRSAGGEETIEVVVEDAGPGVPETERSKIFERFYRGQAAGRRGTGTGTGLGLSLVAEHVRLHGGRVWAEEVSGGGARFVVQLPIDASGPDDPADEPPDTADEPPDTADEPDGHDGTANGSDGARAHERLDAAGREDGPGSEPR